MKIINLKNQINQSKLKSDIFVWKRITQNLKWQKLSNHKEINWKVLVQPSGLKATFMAQLWALITEKLKKHLQLVKST